VLLKNAISLIDFIYKRLQLLFIYLLIHDIYQLYQEIFVLNYIYYFKVVIKYIDKILNIEYNI